MKLNINPDLLRPVMQYKDIYQRKLVLQNALGWIVELGDSERRQPGLHYAEKMVKYILQHERFPQYRTPVEYQEDEDFEDDGARCCPSCGAE